MPLPAVCDKHERPNCRECEYDKSKHRSVTVVAILAVPIVIKNLKMLEDQSWAADQASWDLKIKRVAPLAWEIGVAIMLIRDLKYLRYLPALAPTDWEDTFLASMQAYMETEEQAEEEVTIQ